MSEQNTNAVNNSISYFNNPSERCDVEIEEWWKIIDGKLVITWYSPFVWNKRIRICNIKSIFYVHQKEKPCMKIKGWGLTFSPVWWASDWKRQFRRKTHYNVMVQENEEDFIYKGFTVKNIDLFFEVLQPHLSETTTIYNGFPF